MECKSSLSAWSHKENPCLVWVPCWIACTASAAAGNIAALREAEPLRHWVAGKYKSSAVVLIFILLKGYSVLLAGEQSPLFSRQTESACKPCPDNVPPGMCMPVGYYAESALDAVCWIARNTTEAAEIKGSSLTFSSPFKHRLFLWHCNLISEYLQFHKSSKERLGDPAAHPAP